MSTRPITGPVYCDKLKECYALAAFDRYTDGNVENIVALVLSQLVERPWRERRAVEVGITAAGGEFRGWR